MSERALTLLASQLAGGGLHLDLVAGDLVVDLGQVVLREVLAVVDAPVHADVLLFGHLGLHLGGEGGDGEGMPGAGRA